MFVDEVVVIEDVAATSYLDAVFIIDYCVFGESVAGSMRDDANGVI